MDLPTSDILKQSVESFDTTKLLSHAAKQRDARNYADFPIVDVDCHHYENELLREIVEYFDDPVLKQVGKLYTAGGTGAQSPFTPSGSATRTSPDAYALSAAQARPRRPTASTATSS